MNVICREHLSTELHRTVAVVTKTGIVHHEAYDQLSCAAQSVCCLLKALKAKLLIITPLNSALCSLHFLLCCIMFFCFFSHPESLLPGVMRGVTMNHSMGYETVCKCAHMYFMGDCVIHSCGLWNLSSGQRKRGAAAVQCRQCRGVERLFSVPFLLILSLVRYNSCNGYRAPPFSSHNHKTGSWFPIRHYRTMPKNYAIYVHNRSIYIRIFQLNQNLFYRTISLLALQLLHNHSVRLGLVCT